ncbi:HAD-IIIA family hydrolase [Dysgonomonas sp. 521]|uniref:D-glycero-alpha-D-manno-heptose-1,7-bisphosphate 7-phosphatase n=1 Tax=Dysgonomonas sp. 521 TaxID=2302932 RepID=UPI0013D58D8F|nr:HAD-IIIA family hydrolase [Dysgonomonas sp. 521]NDV95992.1 HAD-IIIA family hydrolase [Dysgonomonas sp. 521]
MDKDNLNNYKYLFLDRDGVINEERPADYVKSIPEFIFTDQALQAIATLSHRFQYIFVVTNQRGLGRGVMSFSDLEEIHHYMLSEIEREGGHIDQIYFCPDLDSVSVNRKPNVGMAFQALRDFPDLDFSKSIMVGNSVSDIDFGNKLGMYTVLVGDKYPQGHKIYENIDAYYENLYKFAENL